MIEAQIKDYLYRLSKGAVKINYQQARHIINLVVGKPEQGQAVAKCYRYNNVKNDYEPLVNVITTDATIQREVIAALERKPVTRFYRFDCYNSAGEFEGKIYTLNPELF